MLKLFKYNFLNFLKKHLIMLIIIIANFLLLTVIDEIIKNASPTLLSILGTLYGLLNIVFYLSLIGLIALTFIYAVIYYKRKVLGDEGYLTHTLPVEKHEILTANILNFFVYIAFDIIIIVTILILRLGLDTFKMFFEGIISTGTFNVILFIVVLLIGLLVLYNQIILAFSLGYSHETKKVKNTIIYGIVIYFVNQALGSFIILITFLILKVTKIELVLGLNIASNFTYIVMFILTYVIINKVLNKKLNLE